MSRNRESNPESIKKQKINLFTFVNEKVYYRKKNMIILIIVGLLVLFCVFFLLIALKGCEAVDQKMEEKHKEMREKYKSKDWDFSTSFPPQEYMDDLIELNEIWKY